MTETASTTLAHPWLESSTFVIDGVAAVMSRPFRTFEEAQEMIERIDRNPGDYLAVAREFEIPGVYDLRRPPAEPEEL